MDLKIYQTRFGYTVGKGPYHTETSQLIYKANWVTGLCMVWVFIEKVFPTYYYCYFYSLKKEIGLLSHKHIESN